MDIKLLLALTLGYLLGSIPFAQIIANQVGGVNLTKVGSRTVGTRNLTRSLGLGWGLLGGALDFGKGALAMCIGCGLGAAYPYWMLAGTAAVIGHCWPVWLRFHGGKGLATAMGAATFVALWPEFIIVVASGWLIQLFTKEIRITALIGFVIILIALQYFGKPIEVSYFVLSLAAVISVAELQGRLSKAKPNKTTRKHRK